MSITPGITPVHGRLAVVTDDALSRIDLQSLLGELLARAREALNVDTAAVLLLGPQSGQLVAAAGVGLEEGIRHGANVPFSRGLFADRVITEKHPVIIQRVDHTTLGNPMLQQSGVRCLLGVPLLLGDTVLGVLHVGTLARRVFTAEDVTLLGMVAGRMALAIGVGLTEMDQAASLQRSLLPADLPTLSGIELASRYLPSGDGGGIGGDWYDVFPLPSGWLALVIGDVVGRGLGPAVAMGRLRSSLRAYALECATPAEVLERLDRDTQQFEPDLMATVLYGMLDPSHGRLYLSTAGHPLPMRVVPGGAAAPVDIPIDPPLGVRGTGVRRTGQVHVPPGTVLVFFTDGLVERRTTNLQAGLERLRQAVSCAPAEQVSTTVLSRLVGPDPPGDDVAVLTLRRTE